VQAIVLEQARGYARILRRDRVDAGKQIESARADVSQVPNRRRHHI
jgi:hypothetical protein